MTSRQTLLQYLDALLTPTLYRDYCPNGLQIEGKANIQTLVTGVTACQALIDRAIQEKADALLVHHGFFWQGEDPCLLDMKKNRIAALLQHEINLIAYHLPLDGHETFGNNQQLGERLGIQNITEIKAGLPRNLLLTGQLTTPLSGEDFSARIATQLERTPLHIPAMNRPIQQVAWCTGGADKYIMAAARAGVDAFISGEISEPTTHVAREMNLHYFAAGHHATERYGVKALGEHIAAAFPITVTFVDVDNPA